VAPVLQAIVFGYVATLDIKHVETVICDEDLSPESRGLAGRFANSEYFNVREHTSRPDRIRRSFEKNEAKLAIHVPLGFSKGIAQNKRSPVQLIIDGSNPSEASIASGYAVSIINDYSETIFRKRMLDMKVFAGKLPSVKLEERVWFNPELKSANNMVPGVIALILMIVTLIVTSLSLVREKETGNLEQIMVTPIKPHQIIAGKIFPYVIIALIDIVLITVMSTIVFKISFEGSFLLLVTLSIFMIVANLGVGILISTVSRTQQQAMVSAMFYMLPSMLLSGFLFPIKNMPVVIQGLTYFIPMRYFLVIVRGIFLKGSTFSQLLPQVAALLIFSTFIIIVSVKLFKKKLA